MTDHQTEIRRHVSDMLVVIEHVLEAIERQRADQEVREHVDANSILIELERVLRGQREALQELAAEYGAAGESLVKKAFSEALGVVSGLYDRVRDHRVSRMLRDDYVALSLAAMSYTALHAFGLAIQDERLAQAALRHLEDITPLMVEISRTIPELVVAEVGDRLDTRIEVGAIQAAVRNTQRAWETTTTRTG